MSKGAKHLGSICSDEEGTLLLLLRVVLYLFRFCESVWDDRVCVVHFLAVLPLKHYLLSINSGVQAPFQICGCAKRSVWDCFLVMHTIHAYMRAFLIETSGRLFRIMLAKKAWSKPYTVRQYVLWIYILSIFRAKKSIKCAKSHEAAAQQGFGVPKQA